MVNLNSAFGLTREIGFSVATLFSFVVLVLGALVFSYYKFLYEVYTVYAALGIATSVLTILTLPALIYFSIKRKNFITSMIVIEFGWTCILWILWLSTGASAASTYWIGCHEAYYYGDDVACHEIQALTAFSFLSWIVLFAYDIFLFILIIKQHNRGNTGIAVTEADYTNDGVTQASAPQHLHATATTPTVDMSQQAASPPLKMSYYPEL